MGEMPKFESSNDARRMAQTSLGQVQTLVGVLLQFIQRGVPVEVIGSPELSNEIFDCTNRNVTSAFEFASRLMQVEDSEELVGMQSEFVQAQIRAAAEQSSRLSDIAWKALTVNRGR